MSGNERRVPGIDLLRGLCILAVLLHHINLRIRWDHLIGPAFGNVLFWNGYYGVRTFFVISGFLIAGWSLKRWGNLAEIDLQQFYAMRFARIVPCLLGLLAILIVLDRAGVKYFTISQVRVLSGYAPHPPLARAVFAALTFHINWLEAKTGYLPAAWDVLWSLSVEEVFYIVFPLACILLRRQTALIALFAGFVALGPFARVFLTRNEIWADYGYFSCMDGIALGCLAALFSARVRLSGQRVLMVWTLGLVLAVFIACFRGTAARIGFYKAGLDVTVLQVGVALLVIALQQRFEIGSGEHGGRWHWIGELGWVPSAMLRWFGRNSYEVYLTHIFALWPAVTLFQWLHQPLRMAPLWFLGYSAVAGCLGAFFARFYSEPLNSRIRSKLKRKASATAAIEMAALS